MQAEESVEIQRGIGAALAGLRDRDGGAHAVVIWFAEGDNYVEAIHGAALEEDDHFLLVGRGGAGYGALQKRGQSGHAEHGDAAVFEEVAPGNGHCGAPEMRVARRPYFSG